MKLTRREMLGLSLALCASTAFTACSTVKSADMRKYECQNGNCDPFIYDPVNGDPSLLVPAGIPFPDLPEDWVCPICGDPKDQFIPLES